MIKYVLYIWNADLNTFCYFEQVDYQAKIVEGDKIRLRMCKYHVVNVEHDFDANVVDLYLKEEET